MAVFRYGLWEVPFEAQAEEDAAYILQMLYVTPASAPKTSWLHTYPWGEAAECKSYPGACYILATRMISEERMDYEVDRGGVTAMLRAYREEMWREVRENAEDTDSEQLTFELS